MLREFFNSSKRCPLVALPGTSPRLSFLKSGVAPGRQYLPVRMGACVPVVHPPHWVHHTTGDLEFAKQPRLN